jgi:hypothetical protein
MPIHRRDNQYQGVNAHLQSFLQNEPGEWESFHTDYITYIRVALDAQLPPGYRAQNEKSLQISEIASIAPPTRTKPDILITQSGTPKTPSQAALAVAPPTIQTPILETLEAAEYLDAVVIYQPGKGGRQGRLITRIELLSLANKPGGSHFPSYLSKRADTLRAGLRLVELQLWRGGRASQQADTLRAGLRLVELDYLHETRPIIRSLPSYPDHEADSHPYWLIVSDSRPTLEEGLSKSYGFDVDIPIPVIRIPLAGADQIAFDFGQVYHRLFAESRLCMEAMDYAQLPARFETYAPADQERIRARMAAVASSPTDAQARD